MSRSEYANWDDPELWSESASAERFSFGGRSPRDIALSIAIVVLPLVLLLVGLSFVGDAGPAGGGNVGLGV